MHFKFRISKINFTASLLLLAAILSGVFSLAFSAPAPLSSAQMVYCPLTKKLQPIYPPANDAPLYALDEFCASEAEKISFALAILKSAKGKISNVSRNEFENLVFDFWQNGKSAFENFPNFPNLPEKLTAKNSFTAIGFGNKFENIIVWKSSENFIFQLNPRPPTEQKSSAFGFELARQLSVISNQIAPRAPPFSV